MNFTGNNSIQDNIFNGAYSVFINPIDINLINFWTGKGIDPSGITGIFVYYSSGDQNIESGYYPSGSKLFLSYISGASSDGNSSGYLYYKISTPIFGTCHGFGHDSGVWLSGYNFYNAFHPEGHISPPFGQNPTVFKISSLGAAALTENGNCSSLEKNEYNDIFGIISKSNSSIAASAEGVTPGTYSFINSPAVACPQELSVSYYWREIQYKIIAGTAGAISANTFYNTNPIPSSLDSFYSKVELRYDSEKILLDSYVDNGDGTKTQRILYNIVYDSYGKPKPNYQVLGGSYILNNVLCESVRAESYLSKIGTETKSLLLDVSDILYGQSRGLFDSFNWWNLWHFLFKENSNGFPFTNEYKVAVEDGGTDFEGVARTANSSNYGSQLFKNQLSEEERYWENRQCPDSVDFLPYTFGGSIYACPSYHFDVPYYAAINKFGFYGTRFFNGCVSLDLNYPSSGYPQTGSPNSQELPANDTFLPGNGYSYVYPEEDEPDEDEGIRYSKTIYDNLLTLAKSEEIYNDFFALNKLFFLWANYNFIKKSEEYKKITGSYSNFSGLIFEFIGHFDSIFPSGKDSLLTNNKYYKSIENDLFYFSGDLSSAFSKNDNYKYLIDRVDKLISGEDKKYWNEIENKYLYSILDNLGNVDTGFYFKFESGKFSRMQSRYFENYVRGNAIDLYPSNKITFSYDKAKNYIDSASWGKLSGIFGASTEFSDSGLNRRYFLGAYAKNDNFSGHVSYINSIQEIKESNFYPGLFNTYEAADIYKREYLPVLTGNIYTGGENISSTTIVNEQNPLKNGWFAIGYNEIGKLNGNYSCFTPIFVQQPLPFVYCKIGQSPTFRSFAVDYHTIPEDKINERYPETMYWTEKLKIINSKKKNRYPLQYKWYRIAKTGCDNDFNNFLKTGYFSVKNGNDIYHDLNGNSTFEPSDPSGDWCCLEGDGPFCTMIHPKESIPQFSNNSSWSYKNIGSSSYEEAKRNNFYMTFKKGAVKNQDDKYYYFCLAQGRFGIRISQASELIIDNNLQFDVSIQNGGNVSASVPISFKGNLTGKEIIIDMGSSSAGNYAGFNQDLSYIPESVVEMQIPPPNRGFGDVYSYRFVGPWGYGGALQSYTPGTLNDTRGLKETWGRFLHYGSLIKYKKIISQEEGDMLYGTNHLPICENGLMPNGKNGIKVVLNGIVHWANMQEAVVSTDGVRGVKWDKLGNAGELYNPASHYVNGILNSNVGVGLGQWQWGNNLGTIHRFGYRTPSKQLIQEPKQLTEENIQKLKDKLLKNTLAGEECGWNKYGLGRHMLYWIEGFNSFYEICDPIKKKNVINYNYMGPALRHTNSSIQYFWLGKPSNTYLKRYPMFGPYSYQWKVMRHNRDRNGNGMSEGFYSYGWNTNYGLMYDAPAIYGLFRKYRSELEDEEYINTINNLRSLVFGEINFQKVRNTRFGFTNGDGTSRLYGNIWVGNKTGSLNESEKNKLAREYMNSGETLAKYPKFDLYGCDDSDLINGDCFDPCISIRYQNGFIPGGKKQLLTTAMPDSRGYSLVPNNFTSGDSFYKETVDINNTLFRGPFGTPHHKYLESAGLKLNGLSPCFDGGADHCNYITPTINLGASCYQESGIPSLINAIIEASAGITVREDLFLEVEKI